MKTSVYSSSVLLCGLAACLAPVTVAAQQWTWVANYGNAATYGRGIAVDSAGNNYTVGSFDGTLTLGTNVLTSSGSSANRPDLFLAKHDSAGQLLWVKKAGGTGTDLGNAVAFDAVNNALYVTGFSDSFTATFGAINISAGGQNIFLAKYDTAGNVVWVRQGIKYSFFDNPSGTGVAVAVDGAGNVYFAGTFLGTLNFGGTPGPIFQPPVGGFNVTNTSADLDIFVAKYDSAGNALWARRFGGTFLDEAGGLAVTPAGVVYLAGRFAGTNIYGPDTLISGNTSYDTDVFLAKLDTNGNALWGRKGGAPDTDKCLAVAVDSTGAAIIAGGYRGSAMSIGGALLPMGPNEYTDAFLAKFDGNGTLTWARSVGRTGVSYGFFDTSFGLAVDAGNNILLTGLFLQDADFGNGVTLTGSANDFFLVKYTSAGVAQWAKRPVSPLVSEQTYGLALDGSGNAYVTGYMNYSSPGEQSAFDNINLATVGTRDLFVGRLNVSAASTPVLQVARNPTSLVFSWPLASAGLVLQSTTNLFQGYTAFQAARVTNAGAQTITVTVPIDQGIRFFRLGTP